MDKDEIFKNEARPIGDFNFNEEVATVFDDMLVRSVPYYQEIQRMMAKIACDFVVNGTTIYDRGCSTGTTLLNLNRHLGDRVRYTGVDYSEDCSRNAGGNFQTIITPATMSLSAPISTTESP